MMRRAVAVVLLVLVCGAGCGGDGGPPLPPLVPVSGKVTLDGEPLSNAQISFLSSGKGAIDARGETDDAGNYELSAAGKPGAAAGKYKVVIMISVGDVKNIPSKVMLPPKFSDASATELTATVPEDGGTIDFPLKSN